MLGDIKSERWARSFRKGGRHRAESLISWLQVFWPQMADPLLALLVAGGKATKADIVLYDTFERMFYR